MIIWISSYPKSGNTFIRSFIASYYYSTKGKFDFDLLSNIRQFPAFRFSKQKSSSFDEAASRWISNQKLFFKKEDDHILKTHNSLVDYYGNKFTTAKETAGAIYIVRDPRNVVSSLSNHYSINLEDAYKKMLDVNASLSFKSLDGDCSNFTFLGSWSDHYKSWKNNNSFEVLFLKYEDFQDTNLNFEKIIKFIEKIKGTNNEINEKKFMNSISSTSFQNLRNKENLYGFSERPQIAGNKKIFFFNLGFNNRFKKILPVSLINRMNASFDRELRELNYE